MYNKIYKDLKDLGKGHEIFEYLAYLENKRRWIKSKRSFIWLLRRLFEKRE